MDAEHFITVWAFLDVEDLVSLHMSGRWADSTFSGAVVRQAIFELRGCGSLASKCTCWQHLALRVATRDAGVGDLFFECNRAVLLPESEEVLKRWAVLLARKRWINVEVVVYCSGHFPDSLICPASQRMTAVRNYLLERGAGQEQMTFTESHSRQKDSFRRCRLKIDAACSDGQQYPGGCSSDGPSQWPLVADRLAEAKKARRRYPCFGLSAAVHRGFKAFAEGIREAMREPDRPELEPLPMSQVVRLPRMVVGPAFRPEGFF